MNEAHKTMHILYWIFWGTILLLFAEFMCLVVYAVDAYMSRVAREELGLAKKKEKKKKKKKGEKDATMIIIDPNGGVYPADQTLLV